MKPKSKCEVIILVRMEQILLEDGWLKLGFFVTYMDRFFFFVLLNCFPKNFTQNNYHPAQKEPSNDKNLNETTLSKKL